MNLKKGMLIRSRYCVNDDDDVSDRNLSLRKIDENVKPSCDNRRFQRVFTACCCVCIGITLVRAKQSNYFENATQ